MAKEKKQLRELSEEELKDVTGGYIQYIDYAKQFGGGNGSDNPDTSTTISPDSTGACPDGFVPSTDASGNPVCDSAGA